MFYLTGAQTWGEWGYWGLCSASCAGGDRSRTRVNSFGLIENNAENCNNVPCPSESMVQCVWLFCSGFHCLNSQKCL